MYARVRVQFVRVGCIENTGVWHFDVEKKLKKILIFFKKSIALFDNLGYTIKACLRR